MILHKKSIVKSEDGVRSFGDLRFRVVRYIVEYVGEDKEIYRKSFESKGKVVIPNSGTHEELNTLKIQY